MGAVGNWGNCGSWIADCGSEAGRRGRGDFGIRRKGHRPLGGAGGSRVVLRFPTSEFRLFPGRFPFSPFPLLPFSRIPALQLPDHLSQRQAVDVAHGEIVYAALAADGDHVDDVRMVELRGSLGLVLEPRHLPRIDDRREGKNLQRHAARQRDLLGLVDHAHPAPSDLADESKIAQHACARRIARVNRRLPAVAADFEGGLADKLQARQASPQALGHGRVPVDELPRVGPPAGLQVGQVRLEGMGKFRVLLALRAVACFRQRFDLHGTISGSLIAARNSFRGPQTE